MTSLNLLCKDKGWAEILKDFLNNNIVLDHSYIANNMQRENKMCLVN